MNKIKIMEFIDKTDNSLYSSSNSDFERVYVCVCMFRWKGNWFQIVTDLWTSNNFSSFVL